LCFKIESFEEMLIICLIKLKKMNELHVLWLRRRGIFGIEDEIVCGREESKGGDGYF
jgi:hypothetical protein